MMLSKKTILILLLIFFVGFTLGLFFYKYLSNGFQDKPENAEDYYKKKYEELVQKGEDTIIQAKKFDDQFYYLTDKEGRTLYTYKKDTELKSNCNEECLSFGRSPFIAASIEAETLKFYTDPLHQRLNLIEREENIIQFKWINQPLYYYDWDKTEGDLLGVDSEDWNIVHVPEDFLRE